jgi:hypothetical protein
MEEIMPKKTKPAVPGFDGPRKTALESIRLFCVGCMGGSFALVAECPSVDCIFYRYRTGTIEPGADRRLMRIIKTYCAEQCLPQEDPAGCTAGKAYLDLSPCPVWPFRLGRNPYYGDERRERLREQAISSGWEANFRPRLDGTGLTQTSGHPEGEGAESMPLTAPSTTSANQAPAGR